MRRQFSIPENAIVATVTDNGSNMVKAFMEYGVKIPLDVEYAHNEDVSDDCAVIDHDDDCFAAAPIDDDRDDGITLASHLRCCSHTLNLVCTTDAKRALKGPYSKLHNSAMGKCSALWNMSGRPKSAEIIQGTINRQLRLPCATRWNSLFDSLSSLLENKDKLNELMSRLGLPVFREAELEFIQEYVDVMHPIALALDRLQADKSCFYGCMLPTLLAVQKKLVRLDSTTLRHCQPLLDAVVEGYSKRFEKFLKLDSSHETKAAILATVSNPTFKQKWLTINPELNRTLTKKRVHEILVSAIKNVIEQTAQPELHLENHDDRSDGSADGFFDYEGESDAQSPNQDCSEMEALKYLQDGSHALSSLEQYPGVRLVFRKYNTPLPSSAPVERLFSLAGHIHASKRNRLSDQMFSQLVFLKGNSNFT